MFKLIPQMISLRVGINLQLTVKAQISVQNIRAHPKKLSVNLGFNLQQQANAQGVFL